MFVKLTYYTKES